jgi:hypothetical protein
MTFVSIENNSAPTLVEHLYGILVGDRSYNRMTRKSFFGAVALRMHDRKCWVR